MQQNFSLSSPIVPCFLGARMQLLKGTLGEMIKIKRIECECGELNLVVPTVIIEIRRSPISHHLRAPVAQ
jgi:hypothetical protein